MSMYFSVETVANNPAAQWTVITAHQMGERMLTGEAPHIALEAAIASISSKARMDPSVTAAQILNASHDHKTKAVRFGMTKIIETLGGEENVTRFFRQMAAPKVTLRFMDQHGDGEDIISAKNRSAMMATRAMIERFKEPNAEGHTPGEREYMEFLKSVNRTLVLAVEGEFVNVAEAKAIESEIQAAGLTDQRPKFVNQIAALQAEASQEAYEEHRQTILARYLAPAPELQSDGPALH